jgi:hypothetical protein
MSPTIVEAGGKDHCVTKAVCAKLGTPPVLARAGNASNPAHVAISRAQDIVSRQHEEKRPAISKSLGDMFACGMGGTFRQSDEVSVDFRGATHDMMLKLIDDHVRH